jgi:hypothetical protein
VAGDNRAKSCSSDCMNLAVVRRGSRSRTPLPPETREATVGLAGERVLPYARLDTCSRLSLSVLLLCGREAQFAPPFDGSPCGER